MADTKEIISKIMEDLRQKNSRNFSEKIYTDQPILIPASKMKNFTPPKYREMKAIARSYHSLDMSTAEIFYKQAKFMEAFEDDYEYYGDFVRYYPTYRDMNDDQLRGYFSWRTKIRHRQYDPAPLAFAFVYIYELLNGVGSTDPKDGFVKLQDFRENFGKIDNRIENYMKLWLNDFAVYYDLDPELIADLARTDFEKMCLHWRTVRIRMTIHFSQQLQSFRAIGLTALSCIRTTQTSPKKRSARCSEKSANTTQRTENADIAKNFSENVLRSRTICSARRCFSTA